MSNCTTLDNASQSEKEGLKKDQEERIHNKIKAREEKHNDRKKEALSLTIAFDRRQQGEMSKMAIV